ncbi:MAG: cysteine hydrolase [Alphaproteobacteria bacterium]|nr:cysteine hydrolase [Alphaproteobacteria bacterium]
MTAPSWPTTRDLPLSTGRSALLIVDVQNYCAHRQGGELAGLAPAAFEAKFGEFFEQFERTVAPNLKRLIASCRAAGVEVMFTTIESLTKDGRDRSLDYKITGFNVARGSWDGRVIDAIAPAEDEIVIPKSSSSVFNSTNIDYVLRNLGVERLAIAGIYTDQCVESAVRDACDKNYLVTLVADACATYTRERHDNSLKALNGYCRIVTTDQIVAELTGEQRKVG